MMTQAAASTAIAGAVSHIDVQFVGIRYAARDTHVFEFARPDRGVLPVAEPGAHVDLHLPNRRSDIRSQHRH
jgi:ferredoxin-NADP reductase